MKATIMTNDNQRKPILGFVNTALYLDQLLIDKYYLIVVRANRALPECYLTNASDFFAEDYLAKNWMSRNLTVFDKVMTIELIRIVGFTEQGTPIALHDDGESRPLFEYQEGVFERIRKH